MELVDVPVSGGGGGGGGGGGNSSNGIKITAPHHKTEHVMQNQGPLVVALPPNRPLTDMMVHWIQHGWSCLVQSTGSTSSSLFMSSYGRAFSNTTFTQYWKKLLGDSTNEYFPPNMVRTRFVEAFTAEMDPSTWEAAAMVMGNSTKQWTASYNSTFRRRAVDGAVVAHPTFVTNMSKRGRGGEAEVGGADEEGDEEAPPTPATPARRVAPILINSEPGRRKKEEQPKRKGQKRSGGSFLDSRGQGMMWGSIGGTW